MTGLQRSLRRIGGPAAISWPSFWVVLAFSAIVQLTDAIDTSSLGDLPGRVAVIVLSTGVLYGVLLGLRRLVLRGVEERPRPGRTLAVFIVGTAVRGVATVLLLDLLVGLDSSYVFRVSASVLIFTPALIAMALVVDRARERVERRSALDAALARLRAAEEQAQMEIATAQAATVERIRQMLMHAVDEAASSTPAGAVERLRTEVDQVIRPISHTLARTVPTWTAPPVPADVGRVAWRELWRDIAQGRPFRPVLVGALTFGMSLPNAITTSGLAVGALCSAVIGLGLFTTLSVAKRVVGPRLEATTSALVRLVVFLAAVTLASVATALALAVVNQVAGGSVRGLVVAVVVVGPVIATMLAVAQAVEGNLREVDAELDATVIRLDRAVARVHVVAWQQQRLLALAVHGPLQARVTAAALRLERDVVAGCATKEAVDTALATVLEALDEIDEAAHEEGDVRVDLADIAEAWEGVCEVRVDLDDRLAERIDRDPVAARALVDVFTEACSNAVRHASARNVEVRIDDPESDLVRILVRDDGHGEATNGQGLGTELLDEVSVRWERRVSPTGSELEVVLPVGPV